MTANNPNVCDMCESESHNKLLYDTSICGICGHTMECYDQELMDLYIGIGFSPEFISGHLPRLRYSSDGELTMFEIGKEISRHVVSGECNEHPCQGYAISVREKWTFSHSN